MTLPDQAPNSAEAGEGVEGFVETQEELEQLASSITNKIGEEKDKYEKSDSDIQELTQHLENKEYVQALVSLFKVLLNSFAMEAKEGFGHLTDKIEALKLDMKTSSELFVLVQEFSQQLEKSDFSISDVTDITYLMSMCKNKSFQHLCKEKQQPEPTPYESLLYNLHHTFSSQGPEKKDPVGTVLLTNRGNVETTGIKDFFTANILRPRIQATSSASHQHAVIISSVGSDGTIYITHAEAGKGVVEESLEQYLSVRSKNIDIMAVDLPDNKGPEVVQFAQQHKGAKYDIQGMAHDTIVGAKDESNSKKLVVDNDPSAFYCSELIFSGLEAAGYEADKKLFTPGDIAKAFTPQYCTTLNSSQLQRNVKSEVITS